MKGLSSWWLAFGLVLTAGCASQGSLPSGENGKPSPIDVDGDLEASVVWSVEATGPIEESLLKLEPLAEDGRVYVAGTDGRVSAFARDTGKLIWTRRHDAQFSGGPGYGDGRLYLGTREAEVFALDADDGTVVWRQSVSSEILSPPQQGGDRLVVQTNDGKVFGLRPDNGQVVWVYNRTVPVLSLRGTAEPVLTRDRAVVGFANGRLAALSLLDGSVRWDQPIAVPRGRSELERMVDIDMEPKILGDVVYTATYQGRISALSLKGGQVLWTRDMSAYLGVAVSGKRVYVVDEEGAVWSLDADSGATVWRQDRLDGRISTAPVIMGDYVAVGASEGSVYWLDRFDGRLVADVALEDVSLRLSPTSLLAPSPKDYPGDVDLDRLHLHVDGVLGLNPVGRNLYVNYRNGLVASLRIEP